MTGGSGFIGSHLVDELIRKGYETYILDNHLPGFGNKKTEANIINGDVRRYEDVDFAMKNIDIVIHLAAVSHVSTCRENPKLCYDINVGGTVNILEACRKNEVERLVVAASDHIYGKNPEYLPLNENHPLNALYETDPYGQSKAMQTVLSQMYHKLYALPVVITASGNVFSERQSIPNVIPNFITAALNDVDLVIHGDGTQTRDFYHVCNLVNAYILCMEDSYINGHLFNIGGENELSVNNIANKILEFIPESKSKIKHIDDIRYNAMNRMILNISKARNILGYEVKVDFEEGLRRTIEAYKNR